MLRLSLACGPLLFLALAPGYFRNIDVKYGISHTPKREKSPTAGEKSAGPSEAGGLSSSDSSGSAPHTFLPAAAGKL